MTLHRLGEARASIHAALVDLLDVGRVSAYPRPQDVGIQVWIEAPSVNVVGNGIAADFPIHVSYDGTDEAQVAGLDDLVARVWDACEAARNIEPQRAQPGPDRSVGASTFRRSVVTVRAYIAARTLCAPDVPTRSPIPPDKTQE